MTCPRSLRPSRRAFLRLGTLALAVAFAGGAHPGEAEVPAGVAREIRALIEAQFAAFAAGDAARAFSYATPQLREHFGTAERFVAMVQASYPVVYRHAAVAFLVPEQAAGEVLQRVQLTDEAGRFFVAVYHLQRQPEGNWRISGCELLQGQGRSI